MSEFRITDGKGFQIEFENGLIISVQFGRGNYCSNKNVPFDFEKSHHIFSCSNSEIAIMDKRTGDFMTSKFIKGLGDEVKGWVTPDELLKIMVKVQAKKIKEGV